MCALGCKEHGVWSYTASHLWCFWHCQWQTWLAFPRGVPRASPISCSPQRPVGMQWARSIFASLTLDFQTIKRAKKFRCVGRLRVFFESKTNANGGGIQCICSVSFLDPSAELLILAPATDSVRASHKTPLYQILQPLLSLLPKPHGRRRLPLNILPKHAGLRTQAPPAGSGLPCLKQCPRAGPDGRGAKASCKADRGDTSPPPPIPASGSWGDSWPPAAPRGCWLQLPLLKHLKQSRSRACQGAPAAEPSS